ncbi:hypothetical protein M0R45_012886 [Rubus argutus]|uniref:Histone deacetylase interacting domain-containing protein n=1 Tax=Rubus argutus TaxID=59490 RepID=A0AAW1XI75_RUBAR
MVNEMRTGRETWRKDCFEYLKTLRKFNHYIFLDFLNLMKDFKTKDDDCIETLKQKVKELFEGCPDLILGFNAFLPKGYEINVPIPIQVLFRKRKRDDDNSTTDSDNAVVDAGSEDSKLQRVMAFVNRVKERFRDDDEDTVFKSFLDIFLNMHSKRNKSSPNKSITTEEHELQIYKKIAALFKGHPDLIDEFTHFVPTVPLSPLSSIIDFSNCKTCTPSYRLLPENFPIPAATHRSELDSQVLNDHWVCVETTTSTNSRGGHIMHKSQHEQNLFRWEEQRFELDRLVESVNSASESIKKLVEKIEKDSPSVIYIKDHLTELDWRCIARLYDNQGLEAMDELRKNIRLALPVMLNRLKQKKEKLTQRQSDLNQRWAQLYVKKRRH